MNAQEITIKIIQELQNALKYGHGIKHPELFHKVINSSSNTPFIFCLNSLLEKQIIFSARPFLLLNPKYARKSIDEILKELD